MAPKTVASAAGTLAAICFVLPGLVMIGWWQGFPYWTTALVTFLGGALGVLFSIPLRRALVTDLRMPRLGGEDLIHAVRVDRPDLPVVVVTGSAPQGGEEALRRCAGGHGPLLLLHKPADCSQRLTGRPLHLSRFRRRARLGGAHRGSEPASHGALAATVRAESAT